MSSSAPPPVVPFIVGVPLPLSGGWDSLGCFATGNSTPIHPSLLTHNTVQNVLNALCSKIQDTINNPTSRVGIGIQFYAADVTVGDDGLVYAQMNISDAPDGINGGWDLTLIDSCLQGVLSLVVSSVISTPTYFCLADDDQLPYNVLSIQVN